MENLEIRIKTFIETNKDEKKAQFDSRLISTKYPILGLSTKALEDFSKVLVLENALFENIPLSSHEEILLAGMVLARLKLSPKDKVDYFKNLLPYIDNWATCDMIIARLKGLESESEFFVNLLSSDNVFYVRVGIIWIMKYMLKKDLHLSLKLLRDVEREEYYIEMALAWCYAEAMIYDFDYVASFVQNLKNNNVKRMAYSKACDSFRISNEQKSIIRELRKNLKKN